MWPVQEKIITATRAGTKIDIVERLIRSKSSGTTGRKVLPKYGTCSDKVNTTYPRYAALLVKLKSITLFWVHGSHMASRRTQPQSNCYLPSCLTGMEIRTCADVCMGQPPYLISLGFVSSLIFYSAGVNSFSYFQQRSEVMSRISMYNSHFFVAFSTARIPPMALNMLRLELWPVIWEHQNSLYSPLICWSEQIWHLARNIQPQWRRLEPYKDYICPQTQQSTFILLLLIIQFHENSIRL